MAWSEVADIAEIERLWRRLSAAIDESTKPWGSHRVGYPGDNQPFDVRVGAGKAGRKTWAFCGKGCDGRFLTPIGQTPSEDNRQLQIDLQCNFRADKFVRNMGGAFLKDDQGNVILANRGLLTRGQRVTRKEIERLMPQSWSVKGVGPHGKVRSFLELTRLESPTLFEELAVRARRIRERLAAGVEPNPQGGSRGGSGAAGTGAKEKRALPPAWLSGVLKGLKKDFTGTWKIPAAKSKTVTRSHGRVVNALLAQLDGPHRLHTTQGIDFLIEVKTPRHAFHVFEVKTSSKSQSIYTAIGRLIFNGGAL